MPDSARDYEVAWAFSLKKETAYNTAVTDMNLTKAMLFKGPDMIDRSDPAVDTDENEFGLGHEFGTRQNLMKWDAKGKRSVKATAEFLGWVGSFGLGAVVTTQPNVAMNPTVYQHVMTPLASTVSKQLPSTSIVEKIDGLREAKYTGVVINDFMLSGSGVEFVNLETNWMGSGKIITSALAIPALSLGNMLWTHSVKMEIGDYGGSFTDYSPDLYEWQVKFNNNLLGDEGYFPGSNYQVTDDPLSGAIRGRLEYNRRQCELTFKLRSTTDQVLQDLEDNKKLKFKLSLIGEVITAGQPEIYSGIIELPHMKYQIVGRSIQDGILCYDVTAKPYFDSATSTYFKLTVVNKDVAYLT